MKDVRGTMLSIGNRVCIQEDIPSVNGMLYKNTIVKGMTKFDSFLPSFIKFKMRIIANKQKEDFFLKSFLLLKFSISIINNLINMIIL